MPELPDVELFRGYSEQALGKKITSVDIYMPKLLKSPEDELKNYLSGKKLTAAERHGKYLFFKTNGDKELVLHFGMTGYLNYYKDNKPDYTAMNLHFENGCILADISVRKLGRIELIDDREIFLKEQKLGADALSIGKDEFIKLIGKARGSAKSFFMNQSRIAGIGNIYTDEILYHAGIHPKKELKKIGRNKLNELYDKMVKVLNDAIKCNVDPGELPDEYLLGRREEGKPCGICDGKINRIVINNRGGYYCPKHQR